MKKSLVLGILGLATAAVTSYGQANIFLDNYVASSYNPVTYNGSKVTSTLFGGFTVGMYYDPVAGQDVTAAFNAAMAGDVSHTALPSALSSSLIAATGTGATAPILPAAPGYFSAPASFQIQASGNPSTFTLVVVAWAGGSSYATAAYRGYSQAVMISAAAPSVGNGGDVGLFFPMGTGPALTEVPMFSVYQVPEPTTLALGGLGGLALLFLRRKQS